MKLPHISEQLVPLTTYRIEADGTIYEAITDAFGAIGIDVYEQGTTLEDWTKDCPINMSMFHSEKLCRVSTII
ncbi:hypothetical protein [Haloplanus sp.]|uniref:hypothetical protein n=1 Tax=Haloplanus sp. TaxID=1961696 RepID=UPI00260E9895|nr:hypothetical protein [Haloplanus sp.]